MGDLIKRCDTTLDDLIKNGDAEEVVDCYSIEELLMTAEQISISACRSTRFNELLYIKRQLEFPLNSNFYDQLADSIECATDELQNECFFDSQGNIEWLFAEDHRKEMIWDKMDKKVKEKRRSSRDSQSSNCAVVISEEILIKKENKKGRVFIISGLARTGKSTILSNYYERIKQKNPDTWVIRIDLVDYRKELSEFNFSQVSQSTAIAFLVKVFAKNSPFAQSLLTHRFQTDGRIVVMLDGFDEVEDKFHEKVFQLISVIKLTKLDALYIATRSHLIEELQKKLFQFAYILKNFDQDDQVDCLFKYWKHTSKMPSVQDESIQLFSKSLVNRGYQQV